MAKIAFPLFLVSCFSLGVGCSSDPSATPGGGGFGSNNPNPNPTAGAANNPLGGNTNTNTGGQGSLPSGGASNIGGNNPQTGGTAPGTGGVNPGGGMPAVGGSGPPVNPGEGPAGYWVEKDWHGCAWTSPGAVGVTTITPVDFVAKPPADPFCIKGSVDAMYASVALLGFNVGEQPPATCAFKAADPNASGSPGVTALADGLAVNFVKRGTDTSFTLRVQIQGPNGHKPAPVGDADRWCATLTEVQGKMFVPYSAFTPSCWAETPALRGTPYDKQPISAVVFSVPGKLTPTPFDFCVNGFTYGATAAEAPDGPAVAGNQNGVVGSSVNPEGDFARAKVTVGGEQYIIQNNNWGNPGGELILNYINNSFKITGGNGTGASAPASFPSIYIGNNGNTLNGMSTKTTDNLPIQISAITSLPSTFRYSGSTGVWNAAYDIWFANSPPTQQYKDGIDGFVMVWLRDPSQMKQPIGDPQPGNPVTVAGQSWNVWAGRRGVGPDGVDNPARVVSFVNTAEDNDGRSQSFKDVDLKLFITKAAEYGIPSTMYLTDVFAGFEIWSGGSGGNLSVDEFKAVVNK